MKTKNVIVEITEDRIAKVIINRPERHNSFDETLIHDLISIFENLQQDNQVRIIILSSKGKNFCAGADLEWMKKMVHYTAEENLADAQQLMKLLQTLSSVTKPIIGLAKGAVMGGGIGLLCCCDIVIAQKDAHFCFSEVKLGLVPATIAPYVVKIIGIQAARYLFLTAKSFTAAEAKEFGLVHEIVVEGELDAAGLSIAHTMFKNGPLSLSIVKKLLQDLDKPDKALLNETAQLIAKVRVSKEAQEGLTAFLEKRPPAWIKK